MKHLLKWIAIALASLIGLVLLVAITLYSIGRSTINQSYAVRHELEVGSPDSTLRARGEHLAETVSRCGSCHGEHLEGLRIIEDPAFGTIPAPNLTRGSGGVGREYTTVDWERAIRHGVGADGRVLLGMPSEFFARYSDGDLHALIAYLQDLPPIDNTLPERSVGLVAQILIGAGVYSPPALVVEHESIHSPAPPAGANGTYGEYLVHIAACGECHGEALTGAQIPGPPPGPDLTPAGPLGQWSEENFVRAMRAGVTPEHRVLDPTLMPWPRFSRMSDQELQAVWSYLQSLPDEEAVVRRSAN